jgi:hypothetical protein
MAPHVFHVRSAATKPWHVEGPEVDVMLCGVVISVYDGEVRDSERKSNRICAECRRAAR